MAGHPERIGKYRVAAVLGEGAMGVVYRGHDPDIDRPVAIKTLHAHLMSDCERAAWLDRFAREARAAGRCLHPNLVTVFDYLEAGGQPWLVMEYIEAQTLEARMAAPPPLALEGVAAVMQQLLAGLDCIHAAGIVHRDVKPANILVLPDGRVKLADFGVARVEALGATFSAMIGTPAYMAPEQFRGQAADQRADLFAAGVVFYELLSGRKPYPAASLGALSEAVLAGRHQRLSAVIPDLPPRLDAFFDRALAVEPGRRFASARDFAAAMAEALAGQGLGPLADWDRTVVAGPGLPRPGSGAAAGSGARPPAGSLAERLPQAVVTRVETMLAERIGPIARLVLRRAAAATNDLERLVETLAAEVAERDRPAFREALRRHLAGQSRGAGGGTGGAAGAGGSGGAAGLGEAELAELARLLAPHLGPMARILVRRAAAGAGSRRDLVAALAREIANERDRAAFLASAAG